MVASKLLGVNRTETALRSNPVLNENASILVKSQTHANEMKLAMWKTMRLHVCQLKLPRVRREEHAFLMFVSLILVELEPFVKMIKEMLCALVLREQLETHWSNAKRRLDASLTPAEQMLSALSNMEEELLVNVFLVLFLVLPRKKVAN